MEEYELQVIRLEEVVALTQRVGGWRPDVERRIALQELGYTLGETIDDGGFSKIKLAHSKKHSKTVAVKIIPKAKVTDQILSKFLAREISILQTIRHPSLIDLYEVVETERSVYMIMEYLANGDLLDYVNEVGHLNEGDARRIFRQLIDAVSVCHDNHICHRDIKLSNILLDDHYNIRLSGFGFARYNPKEILLTTSCGSDVYAPPEIMDGEKYCGQKVDVWAMGVCLFAMINGKLPFVQGDPDVLRNSMDGEVKYHETISEDCRKLIDRTIVTNPDQRMSLAEMKIMRWMSIPIYQSYHSDQQSDHGDQQSDHSDQLTVCNWSVHSDRPHTKGLDPLSEHGLACDLKSTERRPSTVNKTLKVVAEYHSSSGSKVITAGNVARRLRDPTAFPRQSVEDNSTSGTVHRTGLCGPAARRVSVQLGHIADDNPGAGLSDAISTGISDLKAPPGQGLKRTKPVPHEFESWTKFCQAATLVTTARQFLPTSMLQISQEEALLRMRDRQIETTDREKQALHCSIPSKVATICGKHTWSQVKQKLIERKQIERARLEKE